MRFFDKPNNQCFVFPSKGYEFEDIVIVVGKQTIGKDEKYPLDGFPETALFSDSGGRYLNNFQLVFVAEGRGRFQDRGLTYDVAPGSMILIKPGVWHSYAPSKDTGWTEYYVGFIGNVFARVVRDGFPQGGGIRHILAKEKICAIFEKMISYAREGSDDVGFLLKSILMLLISETVYEGNVSSQNKDQDIAILSKARDFMEDHISEKINLADLACDLGISYSTFKKIFKSLTDSTPVAFLKSLRIRKSKFLLATTSKPIKTIGLECGFGTAEYFCNCFREQTGCTPLDFREQCTAEPAPV